MKIRRVNCWLSLLLTILLFTISCQPGQTSETVQEEITGDQNGWTDLLPQNKNGLYSKHGWNHCGNGHFSVDPESGIMTAHGDGGSGLLWYSAKMYQDFILELEFKVDSEDANSGIFVRIPYMVNNFDYIHDSFEVQIFDNDRGGMIHYTGSIYDANPPTKAASKTPGQWNRMRITCQGQRIMIDLNGEKINDWQMRPTGKIKTHWPKGYLGLQNYQGQLKVYFRNIRVKEL